MHERNCERMLLANDAVGALLTVRRLVAVCELIARKTMIPGNPGAFQNRERGMLKPARVYLVESESGGCAVPTVVCELYVNKIRSPAISTPIDDHSQYLRYRVVYRLHADIAVRVVGTGGGFTNDKKLEDPSRRI